MLPLHTGIVDRNKRIPSCNVISVSAFDIVFWIFMYYTLDHPRYPRYVIVYTQFGCSIRLIVDLTIILARW